MRKLTVELTSRCRLRCLKCTRTLLGRNLRVSDLPIDHFKKIVEGCSHDTINLTGNVGDAIYHPQFLSCIDVVKELDKSFELYTNGSGRDESFWRDLFEKMDSGDRVAFSVDGLRDTAGVYRVGFKSSDFDEVMSAMKIGVDMGKRVSWFFIPFSFNEHQIEEAAELAVSMGVTFHVKMSNRWLGEDDPLIPSNKRLISPESRFMRRSVI